VRGTLGDRLRRAWEGDAFDYTRIDGERSHIFTNPIFLVRLRRFVEIGRDFIFVGFLVLEPVPVAVGLRAWSGGRGSVRPVRILGFRRHLAWLLYLPGEGCGWSGELPEEALPLSNRARRTGLVRGAFGVYA